MDDTMTMSLTNKVLLRGLAAFALALPLLATGPCLTTAEQSVINGFFDAVTPLLIDYVANELGVPTQASAGTQKELRPSRVEPRPSGRAG
jgi:hypothetical protein